jgi:hypothetical protein
VQETKKVLEADAITQKQSIRQKLAERKKRKIERRNFDDAKSTGSFEITKRKGASLLINNPNYNPFNLNDTNAATANL